MLSQSGPESVDRHPSDVIRLILGTLVLVVSAWAVRGGLGSLESDVSQVVDNIPSSTRSIMTIITYAGSLVAVGLVTIAALVNRRYRSAAAIVASGVAAYLIAQMIEPTSRPTDFPAQNAAVAAALATSARPILRPRWRRTPIR